jgi:two-component system, NtrC family, response regulator AtoC
MLQAGDVIVLSGTTLVFHADARAGSSQSLIDPTAWRHRLDQEVDRALQCQRSVCLISIHLGPQGDRARAGLAIEPLLRRLDSATFMQSELLLLVPEADAERGRTVALKLVEQLLQSHPHARAAVATAPADATDADTLLAIAREASSSATGPTVRLASEHYQLLDVGPHHVVVADPTVVRLYALAQRLAKSDLTVLIHGETGSGKELLASAIHYFSPRQRERLLCLNCAALAESLVESELFGHERGAFSGAAGPKTGLLEAAQGGTVFLDELGELSMPIQAKLLRAVETRTITRVGSTEERPIDIRLVGASHRDLEAEVKAGRFREDLFFRLSGATLVLPPLRDRRRELPILAKRLLTEACTRAGREPLDLSAPALAALAAHAWPGNVRELKNVMEFFAATVTEDRLEAWHVAERFDKDPASDAATTPTSSAAPSRTFRPIADELRELEQARMEQALTACDWNQTHAAQAISMPLRTFITKKKLYGLTRE